MSITKGHVVYVLDKYNKPLMPTTRFGHVRYLLKHNLAVAISNNPFTIKLKYNSTSYIQLLTLGIDVGRENIGLAVSNEKGECLFLAEVQTNNKQVVKNMYERKIHRQDRRRRKRIQKQRKAIRDNTNLKNGENSTIFNKQCRAVKVVYPGARNETICKVIKGKEARFNNRKIPKGWLTPSARNLIQIHTNLVKLIQEYLPITNIVLENNIFDFQKIENINIKVWERNQGPLTGFKNYKDCINEQQGNICLLCSKKHIEEYHHIVPQSNSGSNTVSNIVGLCKGCHSLVHKEDDYSLKLQSLKIGMKKKYEIGLLNQCMPYIIKEISQLLPTTYCRGFDTSLIRDTLELKKEHFIDAYCISLFGKEIENIFPIIKSNIYEIRHFKKKSNNIIRQLNNRKYYNEDGKLVAVNRHKATEQKTPSLEEYMNEYSKTHTKKETDRHFHSLSVKPAKRVYTYHKTGFISPFKCGDLIFCSYKDKQGKIMNVVFTCFGVKIRNDYKNTLMCKKNKEYNIKNCKLLNSRSLNFI